MEQLIYRDRRGSNSNKWDYIADRFSRGDLLPLWVADMDFATAQCVRNALREKVEFGIFGYETPSAAYYDAFIQWEKKYHGYGVQRDWLRFSPGVVSAFNWFISVLAKPGEAVMIQPPVYYPFAEAVKTQQCRLVENVLVNNNGVYTIDFADFERKLVEENVRVFLMSSPHNPVGRIWTREELRRMLQLCKDHGVYVIADEIHHDFEMDGHRHLPAATVGDFDDILVTLTAPSKTFNLAGLQNSILIIPDEKLRSSYDHFLNTLRIKRGNCMGYTAAQAAYEGGREWLEQVLKTVWENYTLLRDELAKRLPKAILSPLEGTYLAWVDLGAYCSAEEMVDLIENRCRLAVDYGAWFGGNAPCHIRLNLATCRENVQKAIDALADNLSE